MTTHEILIKAVDLIQQGLENENKSISWAAKAYDLDIERLKQAKIYLFNNKIA